MTGAIFPHLPKGTDFSDPRQLLLCANLPELPDNKVPPPNCPLCGSHQIDTEESGMDFPEGTVVYDCMAAYIPPGQGDETKEETRKWEAVPPCWNVSEEQALEILSNFCCRHPELVRIGKSLQGLSSKNVPPLPGPGPGVWLLLSTLKVERLPDVCPICGSAAEEMGESSVFYKCDAMFRVTSRSLDSQGKRIPAAWSGKWPCRNPSIIQLLTLLSRRFPPASQAADACMRALRIAGA